MQRLLLGFKVVAAAAWVLLSISVWYEVIDRFLLPRFADPYSDDAVAAAIEENCGEPAGSDADVPPALRVPPRYPEHARRSGVEGFVEVDFRVMRDGRVTAANVLVSEPEGVFDSAGSSAIERWHYCPDPARDADGVARSVRLRFTLDDEG